MGTFKAIVIEKADGGTTSSLTDFDEANLMDGDVTVRVEYSTVNYKDGLAVTGKAPVVRRFPMIPGVDFAGEVIASSHKDWNPGDHVVLNGWGAGETHLGGYAERARVNGDWLVPLPPGIAASVSTARCMFAVASFTATIAPASTRRAMVSGSRSHEVRPGTLYATTGSPASSHTALKCR